MHRLLIIQIRIYYVISWLTEFVPAACQNAHTSPVFSVLETKPNTKFLQYPALIPFLPSRILCSLCLSSSARLVRVYWLHALKQQQNAFPPQHAWAALAIWLTLVPYCEVTSDLWIVLLGPSFFLVPLTLVTTSSLFQLCQSLALKTRISATWSLCSSTPLPVLTVRYSCALGLCPFFSALPG